MEPRHLHKTEDTYFRPFSPEYVWVVRDWYSPHPINEAEIIYEEVSASRLREDAKMIGGVMRPANIASEC